MTNDLTHGLFKCDFMNDFSPDRIFRILNSFVGDVSGTPNQESPAKRQLRCVLSADFPEP